MYLFIIIIIIVQSVRLGHFLLQIYVGGKLYHRFKLRLSPEDINTFMLQKDVIINRIVINT